MFCNFQRINLLSQTILSVIYLRGAGFFHCWAGNRIYSKPQKSSKLRRFNAALYANKAGNAPEPLAVRAYVG